MRERRRWRSERLVDETGNVGIGSQEYNSHRNHQFHHYLILPMLCIISLANFFAFHKMDEFGIGDAVVATAGSSRTIGCEGEVLSLSASRMLVRFFGDPLESAQYFEHKEIQRRSGMRIPRLSVDIASMERRCRGEGQVPVATADSFPGDSCSRFIESECLRNDLSHLQQRGISNQCPYPRITSPQDPRFFSEPWIVAQTSGTRLNVCPDPSMLIWPAGKATYRSCSAQIRRLAVRKAGMTKTQAQVFDIQATVANASGLCPSPSDFLWTPDVQLWPDCEQCIRLKCPRGFACDVPRTSIWNLQTQQRFGEAQNWCAGRGKCPRMRYARWTPGVLFYPECTTTMAIWCKRKNVYNECIGQSSSSTTKALRQRWEGTQEWRFQAQLWSHRESGACPHPNNYLWHLPLGEAEEQTSTLKGNSRQLHQDTHRTEKNASSETSSLLTQHLNKKRQPTATKHKHSTGDI